MANFLIQLDDDFSELEEYIILEKINKNKFIHSYEGMNLSELKDRISLSRDSINEKLVPIGTIEFVSEYMREYNGIEKEVPIEITLYLQTEEFLKRKYEIVTWEKIPRTGRFFLKDVSVLKSFGEVIDSRLIDIDSMFEYKKVNELDNALVLNKNHLFQVSDTLNIKSEYRVYVIGGYIENICNYNGDVTLFPDIKLIKKACNIINAKEEHLKSYTLDIAVGDFGTAILEIHNFTSVGLYGTLWGDSLLYAYIDGINYLKYDNTVKYI